MTNKISYSAVVLTEASHNILKQACESELGDVNWKTYCHHATINMGQLPLELKPLIGQEVTLTVTGFRKNNKVAAVLVEKPTELAPFIKNEYFHVTVAVDTLAGGKPFMSNQMLSDGPAYNPDPIKPVNFSITGTIQEVQ